MRIWEFDAASAASSTCLSRPGESTPTQRYAHAVNRINSEIPARGAKRTAICAGFLNCGLTASEIGAQTAAPVSPFGAVFSPLPWPFQHQRVHVISFF